MDITIGSKLAYNSRRNTLSFKADNNDDKKQPERTNAGNRNNGKPQFRNSIERDMHNMANNPYYGYGDGCCIPAIIALSALTALGVAASNYNPNTTVNQSTKEITANKKIDCDTLKNGSVVVTEGDASQDFEYIPADESSKPNTVDEPED